MPSSLLRQFSLHAGARIKTLSKGQRARLGPIAAEARRPDLLILDEPSSGLDLIGRRDILEAIIRTVTDDTVGTFLTSFDSRPSHAC